LELGLTASRSWSAPPNLPMMKDGFNGDVGLLVINPDKAH